ncbi:hypothetical protein JOC85_001767 [Bacillus mesophilus]|uniref:DUF1292 domain-containing protein n=1 Tax=Bacillus mesophilus TaxID=1808955 RepID=A0A6M0Q5D1_9BACI|nr:hypothetical protein [Bacillus mesophilus]MBM7660995.1 hypothetical protein [Bacillus mesophilus]NEY71464.1 hypothetical protein [Bacillus mesophilus]
MSIPLELDGAKVLKYTKNDTTKQLSLMVFEEEDGSTNEVPITALAIAQYDKDDRYYLFLCDQDWEVQNDYLLDSIEECISFAEDFGIFNEDWSER